VLPSPSSPLFPYLLPVLPLAFAAVEPFIFLELALAIILQEFALTLSLYLLSFPSTHQSPAILFLHFHRVFYVF
jgi:hypothetical protein